MVSSSTAANRPLSPAVGQLSKLLFSQPLRVIGILRLPGLRGLGSALSTALFARVFAELCRVDDSAVPPFGCVLIAARRPGPSLGCEGAG